MFSHATSSHRLIGLLVFIWLLYSISITLGFFETKRQHQAYIDNHLSSILTSSQLFFRQVDASLSELADNFAYADEDTEAGLSAPLDTPIRARPVDIYSALSTARDALPNVVMLAIIDAEGRRISSAGLTHEREKMLAIANRDFIQEHANGLAQARFYAPEPGAESTPTYSLVSYGIDDTSNSKILIAMLEMGEISRWLEQFSQSTGIFLRLTGANDSVISQHPLEQTHHPLSSAFVNAQQIEPDYRLTIEATLPWRSVLPSMLLNLVLSFSILLVISVGIIWVVRKYHQETDRRKALLEEVQTVLQLVEHGVCIVDKHGTVLYANSHLLEITGWDALSLQGKNLHMALHVPTVPQASGIAASDAHNAQECPVLAAIHAGELAEFRETNLYHRNGTLISVVLRVKPIELLNKSLGAVISIDNVTKSRQREARLRYEAFHDNLTGLANRRRLEEFMQEKLTPARREQDNAATLDALFFIDLDGFKPINDTYGHDVGDMLLVEVAERLCKQSRQEDLVVRQGGDEFVVLMACLPDEETIKRRAQQLLELLSAPIHVKDTPTIIIGASIGVALKQKGQSPDEWLHVADSAMYEAKENGKNRIVFAPLSQ
ncbi:diguanylate cyclase [Vreelandella venusta]|uniref:diguanylate cyclase n=1 Tax=Vreelandella venusta TaxID=44935 RepID=UPI00384B5B22